MKYDVFISFGEEDIEEAQHIKQVLEKNGFSCFFAPDLAVRGENYATEALDAIYHCGVFLLILSDNAQNSKWVKLELSQALDSDKKVFPFIVEEFELNREFNFMLAQTQRVDAFRAKDKALSQLVQDVKEAVVCPEPVPRKKSVILPVILITAVIAAAAVLLFVFALPKSDPPIPAAAEEAAAAGYAADNETAVEGTDVPAAAVTGETGECVYSFREDSETMYISGSGSMADYTNLSEPQPWKDLNQKIKHVVIGDGVTTVCDGAFKNCTQLEDVTLPSGVTSIGTDAFYLCRNLTAVNIPDSVTAIGYAAFAGCSKLETLRIPSGVTEFGKNVFYKCGQLTVICAQDSAAHEYAVQNNIAFSLE